MDSMTIKMDFSVRHLAGQKRRLNAAPKVDSIGFLKRKENWINHPFDTFNFSFILRGEGYYEWQGERLRVTAPMVLTQMPGVPMSYGPDETWFEIYLIYPAEEMAELTRRGLIPVAPVWKMESTLLPYREELEERIRQAEPDPDRIDRLAEQLIVESLLSRSRPEEGRHEGAIRAIARRFREVPEEWHDLDELAAEQRLSLSTLRRCFREYLGVAPAEYLWECRINRARRLLAETRLPVTEVARRSGFADPFYFSRRFRQRTGETATGYRKRYRMD